MLRSDEARVGGQGVARLRAFRRLRAPTHMHGPQTAPRRDPGRTVNH